MQTISHKPPPPPPDGGTSQDYSGTTQGPAQGGSYVQSSTDVSSYYKQSGQNQRYMRKQTKMAIAKAVWVMSVLLPFQQHNGFQDTKLMTTDRMNYQLVRT